MQKRKSMDNQDLLNSIYAQSFRDNWTLPALSEFGNKKVLTYGNLAEEIAKMHLMYEMIGVKPGDKIALIGKNSPGWIMVFMATITYGATIVLSPLGPSLKILTPRMPNI